MVSGLPAYEKRGSRYVPNRSLVEILAEWNRVRPDWEAEMRAQEEAAQKRRDEQRQKRMMREAAKAHWRAGVAKIMAEVRRREALRGLPAAPFFTSDNPLDGARLWDNS